MAVFALSTMWSQGRFQRMGDFAHAASRLGFPAIEINYIVSPEGVEELLDSDAVSISSVHSPTPRVQAGDGRWSESLNLAALDEEERSLTVDLGRRSLDLAAKAGAGFVVFHLGATAAESFDAERDLRRLFQQGVRSGEEVEGLRRRCQQMRAEGAIASFPQAQRSLRELAEHASTQGVAIGLENRYHYHEIPDVDEMHQLFREFPAELVGYWHDMGHAEVLGRLGLIGMYRWLDELGERCLGAHVHDVDGIGDHRAPGQGDADWGHIVEKLPPEAPRVFEINQKTPEEQVAASLGFLRERGVL